MIKSGSVDNLDIRNLVKIIKDTVKSEVVIALAKEETNHKKAVEKMKPVKASCSPPKHQCMQSKSPSPEVSQGF